MKKMNLWREKRGENPCHARQSLEECIDSRFEIRESWMESVVDDVFLKQQPRPFNKVQIGRIGWQFNKLEARV